MRPPETTETGLLGPPLNSPLRGSTWLIPTQDVAHTAAVFPVSPRSLNARARDWGPADG